MIKQLDINCDMGEVLISSEKNQDHLFMPFISSCNIATGAHAGDLETMVKVMYHAQMNNVKIGIHPSYVDRENFGRSSQDVSLEDLKLMLQRQFEIFYTVADQLKFKVNHCKAHGALYHDLSLDLEKQNIFIDLIKSLDREIQVYAMSGSPFAKKLKTEGLSVKEEVFADRRYVSANQLVNRKESNACIEEEGELIKQMESLLNNQIVLTSGESKEINVETICVHSDTPNAINLVKSLYKFLEQKNIEIA